jgi:hypothetical protein
MTRITSAVVRVGVALPPHSKTPKPTLNRQAFGRNLPQPRRDLPQRGARAAVPPQVSVSTEHAYEETNVAKCVHVSFCFTILIMNRRCIGDLNCFYWRMLKSVGEETTPASSGSIFLNIKECADLL